VIGNRSTPAGTEISVRTVGIRREAELSSSCRKTGERHDQLGGNRRKYILQKHEEGDREVSAFLNPSDDPIEHLSVTRP
jgi:hypothetical protein